MDFLRSQSPTGRRKCVQETTYGPAVMTRAVFPAAVEPSGAVSASPVRFGTILGLSRGGGR